MFYTYEIPYDYHRFTPLRFRETFSTRGYTICYKALGNKVLLCQLFCGMTIGLKE
jgi:hypothetical protein